MELEKLWCCLLRLSGSAAFLLVTAVPAVSEVEPGVVAFASPVQIVALQEFTVSGGLPHPGMGTTMFQGLLAVLDFPPDVCVRRRDSLPTVHIGASIAVVTNPGNVRCRFVAILPDLSEVSIGASIVWASVSSANERFEGSKLEGAAQEAAERGLLPPTKEQVDSALVHAGAGPVHLATAYELMRAVGALVSKYTPEDTAFIEAYLVPPERSYSIDLPKQGAR